jgi:tRNA(Ile)-lysidine synthase
VLAVAAGCAVTAVHVDHGLRATSPAEADAAVALAAAVGVPCHVVPVGLTDGPNLEARARDARRAALPAGALTGHTADDRAATLLVNLLRGAGGDGLAAMGPAPTRPILALRRHETEALCAARGLVPVTDPTNGDRRFVRNRVRDELLPLMADIAGRDVVPLLVRTATLLADDVALAASQVDGLDATDARALAACAPALARRVIRRWLTGIVDSGSGYAPDAATVARVLEVATGERRACEITGGVRVERHRQRLRIRPAGALVSLDGMTSGIAGVEQCHVVSPVEGKT